jgi:hypothetical protein
MHAGPIALVMMRTAVKVLDASGEVRIIEGADSARLEDGFFEITRRDHRTNRIDVLLTLRSQDVIGAEILTNGIKTGYVEGKASVR